MTPEGHDVRDLHGEMLSWEIRRVDAEVMLLAAMNWPDKMTRIDAWLDRRLRLMRSRCRPVPPGFTVTDRRWTR